jgi:hypothetical protein
MTKFIVRALRNGTKIDLAYPGRTAERALWRAQRDKSARHADCFVVYDRKTMGTVLAVQGNRGVAR